MPPIYFRGQGATPEALKSLLPGYDRELARVSIITLYSFFEEYVRSTLREVIDFHGGNDHFLQLSKSRASSFVNTLTSQLSVHKRKLQEYPKLNKHDSYRKHSIALREAGFRFPTELFAPFGARLIVQKADAKKGMRAFEIPDILQEALLFDVTPTVREQMESTRVLRNRIAHGVLASVDLKKAMHIGSTLHAIAARIDGHVVQHFLVLERFA